MTFSVISQYRGEEDFVKKEEKKAKLLRESIPIYLNKFERIVAENGGYTVGSTVSVSMAIFMHNFLLSRPRYIIF